MFATPYSKQLAAGLAVTARRKEGVQPSGVPDGLQCRMSSRETSPLSPEEQTRVGAGEEREHHRSCKRALWLKCDVVPQHGAEGPPVFLVLG